MRKIRLLLLMAGFSVFPVLADSPTVTPGEPAPDVVLQFVDGEVGSLGHWLGNKPMYLKFWATWCNTCRDEMPHFQSAYEKYGDTVAVFAINVGLNDTVEDVLDFNKEYGLTMPSVFDATGEVGQAFGLTATPYHVLIDGRGNIVHLGHTAGGVDEKLDAISRTGSSAEPPRDSIAKLEDGAAEGTVRSRLDDAPVFTIETVSGDHVTVDKAATTDKPAYLWFFTTWCESYLGSLGDDQATAAECREAQDTLSAAYANTDPRPNIIGIASRMWTGHEDVRTYQQDTGVNYPLALDQTNDIFQSYRIRRFPTLIVVSEGRITGRYEGALDELPPP